MRALIAFACLLTVVSTAWAGDAAMVIPRPWSVTATTGAPVELTASMALRVSGDGTKPIANWLRAALVIATGTAIVEPTTGDGEGIVLRLDPALAIDGPEWAQAEGYRLTIGERRIELTARTVHGLFNGATTLVQLASRTGEAWSFPALTITDRPRFAWRGLMLDVGRTFFTVTEVKRFIDLMAFHKFNRFHWHLTEDQGWRIEVKSKPKLTSVGAWRAESPTMGDPMKGDGQPYGGFYTHDDIRDVVAYAAERFITVVPEIELPGHCAAAIAAYPELGNHDIPGWQTPSVETRWGVIHHTLTPREETFTFLAQVFDEVLPLFPGAYVHIGGDEAPKDEWQKSPVAQQVIKANNLKDEHGLQSWFIKRVEGLLKQRGKRLIGWDEIQEGGLSPTATMMVWRDLKWAKLALELGNPVVMAPASHTYFCFGEPMTPAGPLYQAQPGHSLPLETVYGFEPIPSGSSAAQAANVLGVQGQLWSEYAWSQAKLEYRTWPRACALADVAWSPAERDLKDFSQRLARHLTLLDRVRVNYRKDDGSPAQPDQAMERTPRKPTP